MIHDNTTYYKRGRQPESLINPQVSPIQYAEKDHTHIKADIKDFVHTHPEYALKEDLNCTTWHIGDTVPSSTIGNDKDLYLDTVTGLVYVNENLTWRELYSSKGTPGYTPVKGVDYFDGAKGNPGDDGADGREVLLQKSATHVQWKYDTALIWTDLIPLVDLKGAKGDKGDEGDPGTDGIDGKDVELQKSATHIQWRLVGDTTWIDLVPLADLKGDKGDKGDQGDQGPAGYGIPVGGTEGQVIAKASGTDYDVRWENITAGSAGYAANVYFTDDVSVTDEFRTQLSYTNPAVEVIKTLTVTNASALGHEYLYDQPVGVTVLDPGIWKATIYAKVNNTAGTTVLKLRVFKYAVGGATTDLFTITSGDINNTDYLPITFEYNEPQYNVATTDKIGCALIASTTSVAPITVSYKVGDGTASYFNTPLAIRHNQLRGLNEDTNYLHITSSEKAMYDALASGSFTNLGQLVRTGSNTYNATVAGYTAYTTGFYIGVHATTVDSGNVYISINNMPTKPIRRDGADVGTGDLKAARPFVLYYSGGAFEIVSAYPLPSATYSNLVTMTGIQTLTNKVLTTPKIVNGGAIVDNNGNEQIKFVTASGAKNEITVTNAGTGSAPTISATGDDTNINLNLSGKGTGVVKANGSNIQPELVSGTNIKTINGNSVLGSGDLVIGGSSGGDPSKFLFETDFLTHYPVGLTSNRDTYPVNGLYRIVNNYANDRASIDPYGWQSDGHPGVMVLGSSGAGSVVGHWGLVSAPTTNHSFTGAPSGCLSFATDVPGTKSTFVFYSGTAGTALKSYKMGFLLNTEPITNYKGIFLEVPYAGDNLALRGTCKNSLETNTTSYTMSANTWYKATIEVNSTGTSVVFTLYSNAGTQLWQQTVTTNIPSTSNPTFGVTYYAGTANITVLALDYMSLEKTLTR